MDFVNTPVSLFCILIFLKVCKALCQRNWCLLYLHPQLKQEKEEAAASKAYVGSKCVYCSGQFNGC